jgi:hypothetical protein
VDWNEQTTNIEYSVDPKYTLPNSLGEKINFLSFYKKTMCFTRHAAAPLCSRASSRAGYFFFFSAAAKGLICRGAAC